MSDWMFRVVIAFLVAALTFLGIALVLYLAVYLPALLVAGALFGALWAALFSLIHVKPKEDPR